MQIYPRIYAPVTLNPCPPPPNYVGISSFLSPYWCVRQISN